jgi:hypothetical protein
VADAMSHSRHDRFAVADAIGGPAPALIATCPSCGALYADLQVIRSAIRDARVPSRTREFLLSNGDAARLRPARWRRLLSTIGTQRDAITRPIALSCTGLGLVGLVLTTMPLGSAGAASDATGERRSEVYITSEPMSPDTHADGVPEHAVHDPLTGLSIGLLVGGGAVFAVRRIAPRLGAVR